MKVYYDIHIHSILSSCADVLQTPNNILNMCMLKGLEMISITDHNTSKQYQTIDKIKDSYDFLVIYGMEVTTKEGFHLLTYFKKYDEVMALDEIIDQTLDKSILTPSEQIITDEYDMEMISVPYHINQKVPFEFDELIKIIRRLNGLVVPAHINRKRTGILEYYQDIDRFDIDAIEIYKGTNEDEFYEKYPYLKKYRAIHNSDAHDIDVINERVNYMELEELSFDGFKKWLTRKNNE